MGTAEELRDADGPPRQGTIVPLRPPARLQRSVGEAHIAFKRRGDATVLAHLYQQGCCKIRLPSAEPGRAQEAVLINTAGGLTDGDRIETHALWGEDTAAVVTSQAAERIYRSRGADASIATRLEVSMGARAAWLPQETILFDHGRFHRRTEVDVAEGGTLLACESLVFGRTAMGEQVVSGAVFDTWRVRLGGKLVFADALRLEGAIAAQLGRPAVMAGMAAAATVLFVAAGAGNLLEVARGVLAGAACCAGATAIGPVLVARLMGRTGAELRQDLMRLLERLLVALYGPTAGLPRVWRC
jgi:urease accessory protein